MHFWLQFEGYKYAFDNHPWFKAFDSIVFNNKKGLVKIIIVYL